MDGRRNSNSNAYNETLADLAETMDDDMRHVNARRIEDIKFKINARLSKFSTDPNYHYSVGEFIQEANALLMSSDAKRARGIIPALIAETRDFNVDTCVLYGVVIELLHFVSLVHDDVLDQHTTRRGLSTLNSVFSNSEAVLTGDYLMYEVINHCLSFEYGPKVIELVVNAAKDMVTGVVMEQSALSVDGSLGNYLEMARRKTGSLFALSFGLPFVTDGKLAAALECGNLFGIVFQIYDDYLDQKDDKPSENIFKMFEHDEITEVLTDHTDRLFKLGSSIEINSTLIHITDYLREYGYFGNI